MDTINSIVQAQPPNCPLPQTVATNSNTSVYGSITAIDPLGEAITYSVSNAALHGTAFVNSSTGAWSYTPAPNYVGADMFSVSATNTSGLSCSTNVSITVQPLAPTCSPAQEVVVVTGSSASGTVAATDPQGQAITFSIGVPPSGGTAVVNPTTGVWNYSPNAAFFGSDTFTVKATNVSGLFCFTPINIQVLNPMVTMGKTASSNRIALGSTFDYIITASNTGTTTISNAVITDTLPAQMQVSGLTVNGMPISGNLGTGIDIGQLGVGATSTLVATMNLLSTSLPTPFYNTASGSFTAFINPDAPPVMLTRSATDSVGVVVDIPNLSLAKSADVASTAVDETIIFTLLARNNGNVNLDNITIVDTLDPNLEFVPGTFAVNSITMPNASVMSGVNIGTLAINQSSTITFAANVISRNSATVQNTANAWYEYTSVPTMSPNSGSVTSNTLVIPIKNPSLQLNKSVDKNLAILGDTLVYTVTITNNGDVNALNVIFKDHLPPAVTLVDGSFSVNGRIINGVNLESGVNLGNIASNSLCVIKYEVKVISSDCRGNVVNTATVSYGYTKSDGGTIYRIEAEPVTTQTNLAISLFKQLNLKNNLTIPCQKPNIEQINDITAKIETSDCYIVESPVGTSKEGQQLTGYKLIIHGLINLVVEYTADVPEQNVHSALYCIPFSSFIVMPPDFDSSGQSNIKAIVEDVYSKQLTNRCFSTNITLLIVVNTR